MSCGLELLEIEVEIWKSFEEVWGFQVEWEGNSRKLSSKLPRKLSRKNSGKLQENFEESLQELTVL
jgi:hypothetical protein